MAKIRDEIIFKSKSHAHCVIGSDAHKIYFAFVKAKLFTYEHVKNFVENNRLDIKVVLE